MGSSIGKIETVVKWIWGGIWEEAGCRVSPGTGAGAKRAMVVMVMAWVWQPTQS